LDSYSQEFKQYVKSLKEIDFELAYLALLTCEGLKPLSRWEKTLSDRGLKLLQRMGLFTKQIPRTVKTGKEIIEILPACCVDQYIRQPYAPNNLPAEEQKILFHWACKNCKITPLLLPAYKSVHNLLNHC